MESDTIIFEGTPLAEYLRDLGIEYPVEEVVVEKEQRVVQDRALPYVLKKMVSMVRRAFSPEEVVEIFRTSSVKSILQLDIIEKIDLEPVLVERYSKGISNSGSITWCFVKRAIRDLVLGIVPVITCCLIKDQAFVKKLIAVSVVSGLILSWKPYLSAHVGHKKLQRYLKYVLSYQCDLRKAVNLIDEAHLINRGYSINTRTISTKLTAEQLHDLNNVSVKTLPGLRIAVQNTTARLAFGYIRELGEQRKLRPLPFHLDHASVCIPSLEDPNAECGEDLAIPNLRNIKASLDYYLLKQQEFVKRLLISLVAFDDDNVLELAMSEKLIGRIMDSSKELRMALVLYRTIYCSNTDCKLKVRGKTKPSKKVCFMHTMCHSARGHLEAALRASISLEDSMEDMLLEPTSLNLTLVYILKKITFHVDATNDCIRRASTLLAQGASLFYSPVKVDDSSQELTSHNEENVMDDEKDVPNSPTDELYEFVGEKEFEEEEPPEDIQGQRAAELERESSRLVLEELKSVLHTKELDWDFRERKVRMRKLGFDVSARGVGRSYGGALADLNKEIESSLAESYDKPTVSAQAIPGLGEPGSKSGLDAIPQEGAAAFDPALIGGLAAEAVAKAKFNQGYGVLALNEEEFLSPGEE